MIFAGIDAGSRTIKVVLLETPSMNVLASGIADQEVEQDKCAGQLYRRLLKQAGLKSKDVVRTVATGYGRNMVGFADTTVTEITCQAAGVRHLAPRVRTVIDIGGQDSKIIHLDGEGNVRDFSMNDRCAAGTGRFLEVTAARLGLNLKSLGTLASKSKKPAPISNMCVVFAETEIIGLLSAGTGPKDIAAGVQLSIAQRLVSMAGNLRPPVVFTGGVALVPAMDRALKNSFHLPITIAPHAQLTGALGAALLAVQK
jgi:predicted CoA-substrate-specific enzyme activase